MKITKTPLESLLVIEPEIFQDERGSFFETWNQFSFQENRLNIKFLQDNQSLSHKGVLRGLHFQNPPFEQGKLVRVIKGAVLDVAVDIRKNSNTYGEYFSIELTGENNKMFWIPPGFAHGFVTLEDNTIFVYKCTNIYNTESERCIIWNDQDLNIDWRNSSPIVSQKDQEGIRFLDLKSKF
ncbi:MAG: dTDP-4-dehydrorhamnose 3,5-epimerase [Bacteroidota bacterium]|nr:dTDP-4-dehydrorhamnose 3,5-epimerase [Bacteroidota bacterium]